MQQLLLCPLSKKQQWSIKGLSKGWTIKSYYININSFCNSFSCKRLESFIKLLLYCNSWISVQIQNLQLSVSKSLCVIIYVIIICSKRILVNPNNECFSCVMLKSVSMLDPVAEVTWMPNPRFKRSCEN